MLLPLLIVIPIASACCSLLLPLKQQKVREVIAWFAGFVELLLSLVIANNVIRDGSVTNLPNFAVGSLEAIVLCIVAAVGFMASWYSIGYLRKEQQKGIIIIHRPKQFYILLHLFLAAMFLAIITTHPIIMWIAIETTTLSTAFLISFYNKPSAMEAAWKYLVINSVGLLLGFFGTILFFTASTGNGAEGLLDWNTTRTSAAFLNPAVARIAFIFVLIGYGTKVGFVPMHTWLPDAHSKAPVPISSLLSGVLLNVAFLAIVRFKSITDASIGSAFTQQLLMMFGLLSIIIPAFIVLTQNNYKRLLAYSSIEHMGIVALGFGFGGIGIVGALLHMILHALGKASLFLLSGNIFLHYSSTKIENVKNIMRVLPTTAVLFFACVIALVGIPPSGLFLTEFYILSAGLASNMWAVIIALIGLVLASMGFLKVATYMIFARDDGKENQPSTRENLWLIIPAVLMMCAFVVLSLTLPDKLKILIEGAAALYK